VKFSFLSFSLGPASVLSLLLKQEELQMACAMLAFPQINMI
jgi:hypothetical protein